MPSTRTGLSVNSRGAFGGRQHHGRGAVADQRAVVERQRVGDGLAGQRLLQGDHLAHVRVRVQGAVGVVLDGHGGQVLARGAVLVHVAPGDHREQRGEGVAGLDFARAVAGGGQDFGSPRGVGWEVIFSTPSTSTTS